MFRRYWEQLKRSVRKGDMVLLLLCLVATAFGCLVVASTTNYMGMTRYLTVQIGAAALGVLLYFLVSSIDAETLSEHRLSLAIFNVLLLLMLIPFGTDNDTGNKSWLDIPLIPFYIQPAEICKITYVLIMASVMSSHQNRISSVKSVGHMVLHLGILMGLNLVLSGDFGISMIFFLLFVAMTFTGGVNLLWFGAAGGGLVLIGPFIWNNVLNEYHRLRIEVLFNPELDASATGVRWHTNQSLKSLTGGGMLGQGLFEGNRTQQGELLHAQHTDYIFSAIGEELGFIGCAAVLVLLGLVVARCIWVGTQSQDYLRRMICFGCSAALIFQIIINVGMCLGITPVIGLTLPFISYGGSSIVTIYAMLGLVSGVYARPAPVSHERYIRPPLSTYQ